MSTTPKPPDPMAVDLLSRRRVRVVFTVLVLSIAVIGGRALYLQSIASATLSHSARLQQRNAQELPAVRGAILDRNGQEIAVGEEALTFYATPKLVKDAIPTTIRIAKIL